MMKARMALFGLLALSVVPAMAQRGSVPKGWTPPGGSTPSASPVLADSPHIQFVNKVHEFGDVNEGAPVTHLYRFRNTGKGVLKISDVHASCGCTAAVATTSDIPPGGVGAIRAIYNTQGRPGRSTKNVTVNTNDPRNPTLSLTFTVNVTRDIDVQPDRVYFFGVKQGQGRAMTVTVLGKPGRHLTIHEVSVRDNKVKVTSEPLHQETGVPGEPKRHGLSLVVTLPEDAPIGEIADEITLKTNYLKKPEVQIPVNGEVVGRVQLFPKSIFMNDLNQPQTVTVSADPPEGFAVRNVSTEKRLVKPWVRAVPQPNGSKQYSVVVSPPNPKSLPPGEFTDTVILKTNDPKQAEMRIPIKGSKPNN